ncbi:hypothetical protein V8A93_001022 [Campylobacter upsaliensis]|nr:hypothetical protein [Campylobacter upsaliensis]
MVKFWLFIMVDNWGKLDFFNDFFINTHFLVKHINHLFSRANFLHIFRLKVPPALQTKFKQALNSTETWGSKWYQSSVKTMIKSLLHS